MQRLFPDTIQTDAILTDGRVRKDYGNITEMVYSIKSFGLIQPIVIGSENGQPILVVGGRRLTALKQMGVKELVHGVHWIEKDETTDTDAGALRLRSMELEENLRRKDMSWPEQVAGKQKLMDIMQKIHGVATVGGGLTKAEKLAGESKGFGERKLAAMLGESRATTGADIQLAKMIDIMPELKNAPSKSAALRIGTIKLATIALKAQAQQKAATDKKVMAETAAAPAPAKEQNYVLYRGRFQENITNVPSQSVDLIHTDLPYGVDVGDIKSNTTGMVTHDDSRKMVMDMLPDIARESFRILKDSRYAVFWFGFNYYHELVTELTKVGFTVNPIPVVWDRHSVTAQAPLQLYANAYEQCLVARKGQATFIRPGLPNLIRDVHMIPAGQRIQISQKPVELSNKFILDMTLPSMTVVDLCAGVGSTGVSAIKLGRKAILFEKDENQCDIIQQRLGVL